MRDLNFIKFFLIPDIAVIKYMCYLIWLTSDFTNITANNMIGWINVLPDAHILILRIKTCECVASYGKRNFADGIKLRNLKWRNYQG